jgi:hypothetical protein
MIIDDDSELTLLSHYPDLSVVVTTIDIFLRIYLIKSLFNDSMSVISTFIPQPGRPAWLGVYGRGFGQKSLADKSLDNQSKKY